MVRLKVGPSPDSAVDDMRQPLPVGHLQPAVQAPGDGDTLAGLAWTTQSLLQALKSALSKIKTSKGRNFCFEKIFTLFFFNFLTRASTAFSAHFSSSSPCFQPSSFLTAGEVNENREFKLDISISLVDIKVKGSLFVQGIKSIFSLRHY